MRALILLCLSLCLSACNPLAKTLSLAVTDDTGTPIANASVAFHWTSNQPWGPGGSGNPHSISATTDSRGFVSATISEDHYVRVDVTHPSHYASSVAVVDSGLSQHATSATALQIPLKRIITPRPLIAKRAWIVLPSLSGEAAYDFVGGDLVAPLGKGSQPDVWFRWTHPADGSDLEERRSWDISFRATDSGILVQRLSSASTSVTPTLYWERSAPAEGYLPSLRAAEAAAGFTERGEQQGDRIIYYFRVLHGDASLYGTIIDHPSIIFYTDNPRPIIEFTYAINPAADRSLEPDPKAVKFPKTNGYEKPLTLPNGT